MTTQKKMKFERVISPVGAAAYAWVTKPDTKFAKDGEEGTYKITLVLPKGEVADEFEAKVNAAAVTGAKNNDTPDMKAWLKAKGKNLPFKDGDEVADEAAEKGHDKEAFRGHVLITFKSAYKPGSFDAANNPLPDDVFVMSGDKVRVSAIVKPYKTPLMAGIKLQLKNLQLIEKNHRIGGSDFDAVEGGFTTSQTSGDEEEGNDGEGDF